MKSLSILVLFLSATAQGSFADTECSNAYGTVTFYGDDHTYSARIVSEMEASEEATFYARKTFKYEDIFKTELAENEVFTCEDGVGKFTKTLNFVVERKFERLGEVGFEERGGQKSFSEYLICKRSERRLEPCKN